MSTDRDTYVVGVDYGTLSGRALVVRVSDGAELGTATHDYPHGVVEARVPVEGGRRLGPDWALQVPEDYRAVLRHAVPAAVAAAGIDPADVIGIATDFTACTMVPTVADGTPLCEVAGYEDRPHAYVKLWKHHAAQPQADRINRVAEERAEAWLPRYGGLISSEWEWAKGLQLFEEDRELYDTMEHWVEAADWIVWQLCGSYVRNACTAGYQGILQDGTYPSAKFCEALAPGFSGFVPDKLEHSICQLGDCAGTLGAEAAAWTGVPEGIAVADGKVDAHVTAPAAQAVAPGQMVAIMGTSTCHVVCAEVLSEVPGMCGVVDGGIVAGSWGYEAGQSGVGDIFGWLTHTSVPVAYADAAAAAGEGLHEHLTRLAAEQEVGEHGLVALDWHSGNRSVLVDRELSGLVVGQTLAPGPRTSTARCSRRPRSAPGRSWRRSATRPCRSRSSSSPAGCKNALLMQVYADVTRLPMSVIDSEQGPALGSAIHAAVAAGAFPDVPTSAKSMGKVRRGVQLPDETRAQAYDALFEEYLALHDHSPHLDHAPAQGGPPRGRCPTPRRDRGGDRVTAAADVQDTLVALRREVCALHEQLTRYQLVVWTAGNVSARVAGQDLMVIKPSGVSYDDLTPDNNLHGRVVVGEHSPSSDTGTQAYVFREMPQVGGVVHTDSTYATAWASRREPVPCVLTMGADEFGGEIPVGPFAVIGDDSIGRGIVDTLRSSRSPAVLMANHGVFALGRSARSAVKAAVMCEDVARTVHVARQLGTPVPIEPASVDFLFDRYQNVYGQAVAAPISDVNDRGTPAR